MFVDGVLHSSLSLTTLGPAHYGAGFVSCGLEGDGVRLPTTCEWAKQASYRKKAARDKFVREGVQEIPHHP
jgi:hypothetical protein